MLHSHQYIVLLVPVVSNAYYLSSMYIKSLFRIDFEHGGACTYRICFLLEQRFIDVLNGLPRITSTSFYTLF